MQGFIYVEYFPIKINRHFIIFCNKTTTFILNENINNLNQLLRSTNTLQKKL